LSQHLPRHPDRVYGVDFSGAKDAGKRIWIAGGAIEGATLRIDECYRADGLPGSGSSRSRCLAALRDLVGRENAGVFGLDFPFGLPQRLVGQAGWEAFVLSFPQDYPSPDEFRQRCRDAAGGRELRRVTDRESKTPFSPYNLRLYRQTYFGIRDVLHPLVRNHLACVLPTQRMLPGRPWVLEICPASTLKHCGLYLPGYKRGGDEGYAARERILEGMEATGALCSLPSDLRTVVLSDRGGDALDSVIAALATFRALRDPALLVVEGGTAYALEGYVYV
jgi:hypothetical protein